MKNKKKLFAIYKNGEYLGNQKGFDEIEAIKIYIVESHLESFLDDELFLKHYKAVEAIQDKHFFKSRYINL
ncbi:hypothetical protein SLW70_01885 [Flavobacterium sp. NG2]|uniref:hypothetical protein n=1 Tax=Flavobacterium sp. NG2 TaxID=3097547 RepID=UPI002A7F2994|nr:hypothetical protein [Flavobacterium sp. NG2]WPR71902.1 hypothetical protein SLW70_01885 [Flavobacterium sp. NG2]